MIQGLAEAKLLDKFNYLSTVSGGGYIGSWLSAWLYWTPKRGKNSGDVLQALRPERDPADEEPPPIRHLREYSSYLTPKIGLVSGDFWAAVAIIFRNLLLNWLILVPLIAFPVIAIKLIAALIHTSSFVAPDYGTWAGFLVCLAFGGWSFGYKLYRLYGFRDLVPASREQPSFLLYCLAPAIFAGFCFSWTLDIQRPSSVPAPALAWTYLLDDVHRWLPFAVGTLVLYLLVSAIVFLRIRNKRCDFKLPPCKDASPNWCDWWAWLFSAIAWSALIWLGAWLYAKIASPYEVACRADCIAKTSADRLSLDPQVLAVIFGAAWSLLPIALSQTLYALLRSYSPSGDFEREWLGRAGGWYLIAGLGWITLSAVVLAGPAISVRVLGAVHWLAATVGISGLITAFFGRSSLTSAQSGTTSRSGFISNIILAVAGPVFGLALLILLSLVFDQLAFGPSFVSAPLFKSDAADSQYWANWILLGSVTIGLTMVMLASDYLANVNRFSLHAVYRNRLVRAYLGASRTYTDLPAAEQRKPNGFTGFDQIDNVRLADLWPAPPGSGWRPYHVINMTLNLPASRNLAWHQRKAMSFTASPLFSGAAVIGYRKTNEYGDPGGGISLGTAMAISGAAVSPNMGYHSSPSLSFLLTLLNVRLGWWLGNPGSAGEKAKTAIDQRQQPFRQDAPPLAVRPLLSELFGWMNENSPYVYLSDGGHFEDLGLYEMVRRRCKWIRRRRWRRRSGARVRRFRRCGAQDLDRSRRADQVS